MRKLFREVIELHSQGLGRVKIAKSLNVHQSTVMRLIWAGSMGKEVYEPYLDGYLTDRDIEALHKCSDIPAYLKDHLRTIPLTRSTLRTEAAIRAALESNTDETVKRTLLWVLGEL